MSLLNIACSSKVSNDTVELVRSTKWPPNALDLNPLDCHIWSTLKQLVYRNQTELFQALELLQQRTENICPHIM